MVSGIGVIGGGVACCGLLWVLFLIVLVGWYYKNQPNMEVSASAPEPPIQATIEHPTAAAPAAPAAPVAEASSIAPEDSAPGSADV